ncbi:MAG: cell division protein FtsA [Candidatus Magasanikbacteria bacterium]|nr:cell division protein FtsA [Candidatus Magasanikbacteria bacterium]
MKRSSPELLAGLDIGSSQLRLAVGQLVPPAETGGRPTLQIVGVAETEASGVHRGTIASIEDVVSAVSHCLERAERMVGFPVPGVTVGIAGLHIMTQESKGVVAVSAGDSEITESDVERVVEASRAIATPLNHEVLHVLPKRFSIDGQGNIKDPVGMTGIRLEVDSLIILGASTQIKNLTKAVYRAGLQIDDLVLGILATSEAVLTARQKEIGVVVVNLGAATTSLAVWEEGDLVHLAMLPIGSEHITNDLAIGLRTSLEVAENVKIEYGECLPAAVSKRDEVDLFALGSPEHEAVKRQYISEIIEARAEEILRKIDGELSRVKRSGLLPAGVVLTGGGAKLPGIAELSKSVLRLPAMLGYPLQLASVTEKVNDLGYSTAVGLVKWASLYGGATGGGRSAWGGGVRRTMNSAGAQIKKWVRALIP